VKDHGPCGAKEEFTESGKKRDKRNKRGKRTEKQKKALTSRGRITRGGQGTGGKIKALRRNFLEGGKGPTRNKRQQNVDDTQTTRTEKNKIWEAEVLLSRKNAYKAQKTRQIAASRTWRLDNLEKTQSRNDILGSKVRGKIPAQVNLDRE